MDEITSAIINLEFFQLSDPRKAGSEYHRSKGQIATSEQISGGEADRTALPLHFGDHE